MPGQDREGNVFASNSGREDKVLSRVLGEGAGTGCDLLSDLQVRLRERPRLTLLWYVRARPGLCVGVNGCVRFK